MIRGIYAAASGMVSSFRRQMIVTNNLENASTTGYKQDIVTSSEFANLLIAREGLAFKPREVVGALGTGTQIGEVQLDLGQGALAETGNPLDLAITGPGFFAVQTPSGILYTRDGTFSRDAVGNVTTADGGLVLGENGPLQVGEGEIAVDGDGTVSVDGQVAGRIRLVDFDPQAVLLKVGGNYLAPADPNAPTLPADGAVVNQGYLERSNVDLEMAMVEMLSALRSYEADQKMVQLQDQTLDRAVNDIGKV